MSTKRKEAGREEREKERVVFSLSRVMPIEQRNCVLRNADLLAVGTSQSIYTNRSIGQSLHMVFLSSNF